MNLFLGWTLLGWVVALAWASTNPGRAAAASPRRAETPVPDPEEMAEFEAFRRWKQAQAQPPSLPPRPGADRSKYP